MIHEPSLTNMNHPITPWFHPDYPIAPIASAPQGVRLAELLAGATDVDRVLRHQRRGVAPGAHGQHHPGSVGGGEDKRYKFEI